MILYAINKKTCINYKNTTNLNYISTKNKNKQKIICNRKYSRKRDFRPSGKMQHYRLKRKLRN